MDKDFEHEPEASRYILRMDGDLAAVVDYRINGSAISFTRTFTTPKLRGHGLAGELVEYAAKDVEVTSDRHIVPMCWYVGEWFDKNPGYAGLLSRRTDYPAEVGGAGPAL